MQKVISLFDYTGLAVKDWADDGYDCHIYDIKHWRPSTHKEGYIDALSNGLFQLGMGDYIWTKIQKKS